MLGTREKRMPLVSGGLGDHGDLNALTRKVRTLFTAGKVTPDILKVHVMV